MAGTGFREIESRLVLTADPTQMMRSLRQAQGMLGRIGGSVQSLGAMTAATGIFDAIAAALNIVGKEYDKVAGAATRYSAVAAGAKARADMAEVQRDIALARENGPQIAAIERGREGLAQVEAANAHAVGGIARGWGEAKNIGSAGITAARLIATGTNPLDAINQAGSAIEGGAHKTQINVSGMDLLIQLWRDFTQEWRSSSRNGGG